MNSHICLLAGMTTLSMSACATAPAPMEQPLAAFPFRHDAFDVEVAWKTAPATQGTQLEGVLQNVRYVQILDVGVDVLLLTPDKKELAKGRSFTSPNRLNLDQQGTFHLILPHSTPAKGDLLQFIVTYTAVDGTNPFYWVSSFTVDALSGTLIETY